MSDVYASHLLWPAAAEYLTWRGHRLRLIGDDPRYGPGTEAHADLRLCQMGPEGPVLHSAPPDMPEYPYNAAMCALVLDKIIIHRLDITDKAVLQYCRERGYREVNVRQGYTRCSCAVVDGRSVITSDPGILRAAGSVPELDVLEIRAGFVALPGYDAGFIGGACGIVGGELIFNGDLSAHPDFERIRDFAAMRGVGLRFFPGLPLTDIGSIIEDRLSVR